MKGRGNRVLIVIALVVISLVAIFIFAKNSKYDKGYRLIGLFPNSAGLSPGQEINCLGQKIGYIQKTELQIPYRRVVVTMLIGNDIDIPTRSILEVNINSLLGSKSLAIIPPNDSLADVFCQPNDTLQGQAPVIINSVLKNANTLITTAKDKVNQVDVSALNQAIATIQHTAGQIDTAVGDLRPQIDATIYKANQLITTYQQAGEKIETTVVAIDSLVRRGSKGIDSLPPLIQKTDSAANAIRTFFKGLNRFFGFHD